MFAHYYCWKVAFWWQLLLLLLLSLLVSSSSSSSSTSNTAHHSTIFKKSPPSSSSPSSFESWTNHHANNRPMQTNPSPTSQTRISLQTLCGENDDDDNDNDNVTQLRRWIQASSSYDLIVIGVPDLISTTAAANTTTANTASNLDRFLNQLDAEMNGIISSLLLLDMSHQEDDATAAATATQKGGGAAGSTSSVMAILPVSPLTQQPSTVQDANIDSDNDNDDDDKDSDFFSNQASIMEQQLTLRHQRQCQWRRPTRVVLVRMGDLHCMKHATKVGASLASLMLTMTTVQKTSSTATATPSTQSSKKKKQEKNDDDTYIVHSAPPPAPSSFAVLLPLVGRTMADNDDDETATRTTRTRTTTSEEWITHFTMAFLLGFYKDRRFQNKKKKTTHHQQQQQQCQRTVDLLIFDLQGTTASIANNSTTSNVSATTTMNNTTVTNNTTATNMTMSTTTSSTEALSLSLTLLEQAVHRGGIFANGIALCRDIVNAPHNVLNSWSMAATAMQLTRQYSQTLKCHILNADECEALGMGAFLGVARASETSAQFIHLTYKPPPPIMMRTLSTTTSSSSISSSSLPFWSRWNHHAQQHQHQSEPQQEQKPPPVLRKLGIVGKGLLFDTGGYSIKTSTGMLGMKMDCGGAGAVLGAAQVLAELQPQNVEIHFLIAACENMINGKGMVPGDILMASNGKTIEVIDTDAEGRLTMADALVYADLTLQCDAILELSTLTGACMMALGSAMAGYWTRNDKMAAEVECASSRSGEQVWRLPMAEADYGDEIKSNLADLRNMGTNRMGGAIHAALFLQHFVRSHVPFCHVDIAGPAMNLKSHEGTGWGTKLITEWVLLQQQQQQQQQQQEQQK